MARKTQNEITKEDVTPNQLLAIAIQSNLDVDKLDKLLDLQIRYEGNQAKKLYADAFSKAQSEIDSVVKTKTNPQTHSKYADLTDIITSVKPIYTKYDFSVIFYEGKAESKEDVRVCADVLHSSGHKETYYLDMPIETTGIKGNTMMTRTHGKGSAVSYGRRYLMCMIWNIPTLDNDGNGDDKPEPKSKNMLIEQVIKDAYAEYSKSHKITEDRFKTELKNVYTDLEPEDREGFNWNEKGVKFLLSKFVSNDAKSTKKVAQAANTEPQSATEQLRELF